jgi:predicted DNA-binding protein with PD1-like motif
MLASSALIRREENTMKYQLLRAGDERTWAVVFEAGEEAARGLDEFARAESLDAARFTAIGGFSRATLGYFNINTSRYEPIAVDEQVEVLSLLGDIARGADGPKVHAHVVVGTATGAARGGHLLEGHVRPTLEVLVTEEPGHLCRRFAPKFGIALIDMEASRGSSGAVRADPLTTSADRR